MEVERSKPGRDYFLRHGFVGVCACMCGCVCGCEIYGSSILKFSNSFHRRSYLARKSGFPDDGRYKMITLDKTR